jgi:hypothetical protein
VVERLQEAPEILPGGQHTQKPIHGVEHTIKTSGRPVFAKARRLDPIKLCIAKKEFEKMEAAGICRRSDGTCELLVVNMLVIHNEAKTTFLACTLTLFSPRNSCAEACVFINEHDGQHFTAPLYFTP